MHRVYELSEGNEHKSMNMWDVGKELDFGGFGSDLTHTIVQYLMGEGLIRGSGMGGYISITHYGIKEIEEALEKPNQPTEHFAPFATINLVHVDNMVNSQIQQSGTSSTQSANINQTTLNEDKMTELKEIISILSEVHAKESLTTEQKNELQTEIETLSIQAKASKPKFQRIKDSLEGAKNVLESAAVGAMVIAKIVAFLHGIQS